jgi:hypothetical protein
VESLYGGLNIELNNCSGLIGSFIRMRLDDSTDYGVPFPDVRYKVLDG